MGLRDIFSTQSQSEQTGYEALKLSSDGADAVTQAVTAYPRDAIVARPHRDNEGIPAMQALLESLYTTDTHSSRLSRETTNTAAAHAFELRYARERTGSSERLVTLQYVAGSDARDGMLEQQLEHRYPNTILERRRPAFLDVDAGQYVAGASLGLRRYTLYPIRSIDLDGFGSDPTGSIIQEMVGLGAQSGTTADADVIVQIMFKPAMRDWLQGVENGQGVVTDPGTETPDSTVIDGTPSVGDLIHDLKSETEVKHRNDILKWKTEWIDHDPSKRDLDVAKMLDEQDGKAWRLFFRIFAVSDDPEVAISRASKTAGMFRNYYEYRGEQTFLPQPFSRTQLPDQLQAGAHREWEDAGIVKTQNEVAGLVNVPTAEDVSSGKMRWTLAKPGDGVPPKTARCDFDALGVAGASWNEQYLAMINAVEPGGSVWFGRGVKHGIEAGVYDQWLKRPTFVLGESGNGKTKFVINIFSQAISRGDGALVIDPPGQDADEFIAEWPEDRDEDDLIVLDLNREDLRPQFNFLELPGVPEDIDPDSYAASRMIESLADDLEAMVAQAGGTDKYVGSSMKRVLRASIRGVLNSKRNVHLLDLACLVSRQENLAQFAQWMDEERITFIRERARQYADNKTDDDLDPLAGRMDEWIHNDIVRDMIATRNPSFSIHEAVKDGKVIVVKFGDGSGDNLKQLLSTALIRRTYTSKQIVGDEDPFWLFCDEFDSVVTPQSKMESIVSEARKFNYRCFLCCQSPANQLYDDMKKAIADNAKTFVAFGPGSKSNCKFAATQHTIDWTDFQNVDPFKFYLKVIDDENVDTNSFLVEAPTPLDELQADVAGIEPRTQTEIDALKQHSLEQYGRRIKTAEEQRESSYFGGEGGGATLDNGDDSSLSVADDRRDLIETLSCKAAYDAVIHATKDQYVQSMIDMADEPDLFSAAVDVGREAADDDADPTGVYGRFLRYLRDVDPQAAEQMHMGVFSSVVESLSEVEICEDDGRTQITCTNDAPTRFKGTGDDRTSGGLAHGKTLQDAYEPLTRLGLEIQIVEQTGEREVDAIGKLRESLPELEALHRGEITFRQFKPALEQFKRDQPLLYELTGGEDVTIEAEKSTARSPGKTARNLAKAYETGQKCLFLAAPDKVHRVYNGLTDPPFVREDEGDRTRLYHVRKLSIGEETPLRPNTTRENHWYLDHETGDLVLTDGQEEETELARFDSLDAVESSLDAYPDDTRSVEAARIGQNGDWRYVKRPFDPRAAFGESRAEWPTDEHYEVLSVEDESLLCLVAGVLGPLRRLRDPEGHGHSTETQQPEASNSADETQPAEATLTDDIRNLF
jgi:hypothetical protein